MAGKKNNELIENLTLALQSAFGRKPTDVSGLENITTSYYFNYLLRLVKGIFEVKMPDYWDSDFLLDTLFLDGVIGIFENN